MTTTAKTPNETSERETSASRKAPVKRSARSAQTGPAKVATDDRAQLLLRMSRTDRARLEYWSKERGYPSLGDYAVEAVQEKIARENGDYALPTLEIARLNQLVDEVKALSTNQANLERILTQGFDSLLGVTRGDNYLLDEEDGELP